MVGRYAIVLVMDELPGAPITSGLVQVFPLSVEVDIFKT